MLLPDRLRQFGDLSHPAFFYRLQPLFRLPPQFLESCGEKLVHLTGPKLFRGGESRSLRLAVAKVCRLCRNCVALLRYAALLFQEDRDRPGSAVTGCAYGGNEAISGLL